MAFLRNLSTASSRYHVTSPAFSAIVPITRGNVTPALRFGTRCGLLGLLLLGEVLALTVRFDAGSISDRSGWGGMLFRLAPQLVQGLFVSMIATALLARRAIREEFLLAAGQMVSWPQWLLRVTVHFACYGTLFLTTAIVFERGGLQSAGAPVWSAVWLLSAALTAASGALTLAPSANWIRLCLGQWRWLLCGGLIGGATLAAGYSARSLWEPLSDWTLAIVWGVLSVCFSDAIINEATRVIGTSRFQVRIAPQCSGYEGIGLIVMFLTAFFISFRKHLRFPHAWLLWPVAIVVMWLCNALRIALLIVIGTLVSPEIALGGFHSQAGWISFNLISLVMMACALRSSWIIKDLPATPSTERAPAVEYLVPFLTLMAANVLAAAFSNGFDVWYPAKVLLTAGALWLFAPLTSPRRFGSLNAQRVWGVLVDSAPAITNGIVVFVLWVMMTAATSTAQPMPTLLQEAAPWWAGLWIAFRIIGSVLSVPIVEELAFRGFLMRRFVSEEFETCAYRAAGWGSVLASSVLFGLMHQHWIAGTVAGIAYALAARRRNRLSDAMIAHAVTNGLIALAVVFAGAWWLW